MKKLQTLPVSSRQHNPPAPLKGRTASPAGKLCTGRDGLRALLTDTAGSRQPAYTPFSARIIPGTCSYSPYRSDIFKILFGIIIKIHERPGEVSSNSLYQHNQTLPLHLLFFPPHSGFPVHNQMARVQKQYTRLQECHP